jgi:methylenetetrahydrofolate dehydrogenase (NADP+)/methenyltetrahydrofolate cyclohydrolase
MIINGKEIAARIKEELRLKTASLEKKPGLAVVRVGDDPASKVYVNIKEKVCKEIGFHSEIIVLEESVLEKELLELIDELNQREDIHGILVQLPLPRHIDEEKIILAIDSNKDVDGFHPMSRFTPCTPKGVMELIQSVTDIEGKHAVVIGRSNIVGKPVARLLLDKNATVTVCHSRTKDLASITRQADILVAAVGKAGLVTKEMVKEGAVVIDVGINRVEGKLVGDVDFAEVSKKVSYITPVPGGVGPMTVACLMQNTMESYESHP